MNVTQTCQTHIKVYVYLSMKRKNILGQKYNMLTAIKYVGSFPDKNTGRKRIKWLFRCECGVERVSVFESKVISCGCVNRIKYNIDPNKIKKTLIKYGKKTSEIPEYQTWASIKARCYRLTHVKYKNYGGRGISVCESWLNDFSTFLKDMGEKPTPKHSIDRIDVNGDYEPNNCRWATIEQQSNNKTTTRFIEYNGVKYSMRQLSQVLKCKYTKLQTLYVRQGKTMKDIIDNNLLYL